MFWTTFRIDVQNIDLFWDRNCNMMFSFQNIVYFWLHLGLIFRTQKYFGHCFQNIQKYFEIYLVVFGTLVLFWTTFRIDVQNIELFWDRNCNMMGSFWNIVYFVLHIGLIFRTQKYFEQQYLEHRNILVVFRTQNYFRRFQNIELFIRFQNIEIFQQFS